MGVCSEPMSSILNGADTPLVVLSHFPQRTITDFIPFRNPTPPLLADCREAFKLLPSGAAPILWYTEPAAGEERNVLPLEVHFGQ